MNEAPKKDIRDVMRPSYIRCWQMFIHILNRWSVMVPFEVHDGATGFLRAASNKDTTRKNTMMAMSMVWFFVPTDCTNKFEIVRFLDRELETERREAPEPATLEDGTYTAPGTEAHIYPMVYESDVMDPYMTEAQRHLIQTEMFKQLAAESKRKDKEKTIGGAIFGAMVEATAQARKDHPELFENSEDDEQHAAWGIGPEDFLKLGLEKEEEEEEEEDGEKR